MLDLGHRSAAGGPRGLVVAGVVVTAIMLASGCHSENSERPDADAAAALDDVAAESDGSGATARCPFGEADDVCLPEPPRLRDWDCPDGWLAEPVFVDADGAYDIPDDVPQVSACAPPPVPADCPPGWMQVLGSAECVRQGLECPPLGERWHDEETIRSRAPLHFGPIVYVDPTADDDGAGTRTDPVRRIGRAAVLVDTGGIIALANDEFRELALLNRRVALVGSCVEGSVITAPEPHDQLPTVRLAGSAETVISDLTIRGARRGLVDEAIGLNKLQAVRVADAEITGIFAFGEGMELELEDVVIADIHARSGDGAFGWGISLEGGGRLRAERVVVARAREVGIFVANAANRADLVDIIVMDTRGSAGDNGRGNGFVVGPGSELEIERGLLARNREFAVLASGEDTRVELHHVVVRDTAESTPHGMGGYALSVRDGAEAVIAATIIERATEIGINVRGAGASTTLTDVVIRDTQGRPLDGEGGAAIVVAEGGALIADRLVASRNRERTVFVSDAGSSATLRDAVLYDTLQAASEGDGGSGCDVEWGATLSLERSIVERSRGVAIVAFDPETRLDLIDVRVRGTLADARNGLEGRGLVVQEGAHADLQRVLFEDNREVAVFVAGVDAVALLREAVIRETLERLCADPESETWLEECTTSSAGTGVVVIESGRVELTDFAIVDNALIGVQLVSQGVIDTESGVIGRSLVGVNVQVEGFDLDRWFRDVRMEGNTIDIDWDAQPVPGVMR